VEYLCVLIELIKAIKILTLEQMVNHSLKYGIEFTQVFGFRGWKGWGRFLFRSYLLVKWLYGAFSWKLLYKSVVDPMCLSPHPPQNWSQNRKN